MKYVVRTVAGVTLSICRKNAVEGEMNLILVPFLSIQMPNFLILMEVIKYLSTDERQ